MEPGPSLGVGWILMGVLIIALRRAMARATKRTWDTTDRAFDEDALAWWSVVIGVLAIIMGSVALGIWAWA